MTSDWSMPRVTTGGTNYGKIINEVMVLLSVRFLNEVTGKFHYQAFF